MSIVVTGATGRLGRIVVEQLLERGASPQDVVATGRDVARLRALAEQGVVTRPADFTDQEQLEAAFAGAEKVLVVSTTTVGERFDKHRRAIDAAHAAGAAQIVYVSAVNADTARMRLADEHRRTEQYLRAGDAPFTILRNGWYLENYADQLPVVRAHGAVLGAAGDGRVSAASRADLAAAAAAVLLEDDHLTATYELGGAPFTLSELASVIGEEVGRPVEYVDLPEASFAEALVEAGVPLEMATLLADADTGLGRGELFTESDDLERLIGRPPTSLREVVRAAL